MLGFLKFWKWGRKKKKITPVEVPMVEPEAKTEKVSDKPTLYPSRNMALITTESDAKLRPVKVLNDHKLEYGEQTILIKPDRPAHILDLNLHELMPTRKQRFMCKIFGVPKYQTFRMFAFQMEGEMTHDLTTYDPNEDGLSEDMKMRFEKMLLLVGKFAEADAGAVIYEGIKGAKKWWDYIPYIIIAVIVGFFLFAFQVQPNL